VTETSELIARAKKRAVAVYIAVEEPVARDIADTLNTLCARLTEAEREREAWDRVLSKWEDAYPTDVWPETPFTDAQAASVMRLMMPRLRAAVAIETLRDAL
jgi:hypothetical protein